MLAREQRVDADVVVPVPDSGVCAAMGFADEAGLPLRMGLIRNHYVGRTFIQPQSAIRHFGVKVKLNPVRSILEGRRVVLVDDSIVRGTTSRKIVGMVRAAGASEVHVRISCPPTISPCFYGVDTPRRSELIAATHSLEEVRDFLEADSLGYLSHEGLMTAVGIRPDGVLQLVLHRAVSGRVPEGREELSAAGAQARQGTDSSLTDAMKTTKTLRAWTWALLLAGAGTAWVGAAVPLQPAQEPSAPAPVTPEELQAAIDKLGHLDYPTRMAAARTVRRTPNSQAAPALLRAVDEHKDGYVRYRALVLLTGFNDPRTGDAMREALSSPND